MIYFLWLAPIFAALILFAVNKNYDSFRIGAAFLGIVICYTLIHQWVAKDNLMTDTEWWGHYATGVHYYDDWDEEVPCRHPIYCTRTYECNCDSNGNNCSTCTEQYICGYEHPYDVDYHPEYWSIRYDNRSESGITRYQYYYYSALWGNKLYKVELNRDYHSNDGDDMACDWDNRQVTSEMQVTRHTYENRIQASNSVFRAERVDSTDIKAYKLYAYDIKGNQIVYGKKIDERTERMLKYVNGYIGSKKQFKLYVCVFENQSEVAAERQHSYWDNLNKNEFLVCLGIDDNGNIEWNKTYSWMDKPALSTKVEQYFRDNKKLDLAKFAEWLPPNVDKYWSRKHFSDFSYIQVELTAGQYFAIFFVVMILIGIQVVVTMVSTKK